MCMRIISLFFLVASSPSAGLIEKIDWAVGLESTAFCNDGGFARKFRSALNVNRLIRVRGFILGVVVVIG